MNMKQKYKFAFALTLPLICFAPILSSCSNSSSISDNNDVDNKEIINLSAYAEISKQESLTGRLQTNKNYSLNEIINIGNEFINSFSLDFKKDFIIQIVENYFKNYINSKGSTLEIENKTIFVENDILTIDYKLIYKKDFVTSLVAEQRKNGDIEEYKIVFDLKTNNIFSYINTAVTNYLSFKLKPDLFSKKLLRNNSTNYEYQIHDRTIEFNTDNQEIIFNNEIYPLSIDFNNSLNSINLNNFLKNSYLYNKSNDIEKKLYLETIKLIENRESHIYFAVDQENSYYPNVSSTGLKLQGIIEQKTNIDISKISKVFLSNLSQELMTMYNFPTDIKCVSNNKDNFLLISPSISAPLKTIKPEENNDYIIDLTTNQKYEKTYISFMFPNNSYKELIDVKNEINNVLISKIPFINKTFNINITESEIENNFSAFMNVLSIENKCKLIYEILLPHVSYGQLNRNPSNIIGFIEKKVLCQGYALIFSYLANIFGIKNLFITGYVATNAVPGQSASDGLHAWNVIFDGNNWKWFDPTWDDSFLISDSYKFDNFMQDKQNFFSESTHKNITNWDNGNYLDFYKS